MALTALIFFLFKKNFMFSFFLFKIILIYSGYVISFNSIKSVNNKSIWKDKNDSWTYLVIFKDLTTNYTGLSLDFKISVVAFMTISSLSINFIL